MGEHQFPKFISDLLHEIIKENGFRDYSVEVKQGSQIGDGFMSELSSITITENYSEKQLHLVCKMAPLNENRRKEFRSDMVFGREVTFYNKLMPSFTKFQQEKNVPENDQFRAFPKCYGAVADDEKEEHFIFLEDLRPQGFKMWNKAKVAQIENVRLAMREIGKFHGISIAMKHQRPEVFSEYQELSDILKKFLESSNMQDMFNSSYDRAIVTLKKEEHKNIFRGIRENVLAYFDGCTSKERARKFGVIVHGTFL